MAGQLVYLVCDAANIDSSGACTQVQYVQAPTMLPPLDVAGGTAIAIAMIGLWALAAVYKSL